MKQQRIEIIHDFPQSVEKVFAWIGNHNNLGEIFFPFTVTRIKDGQGDVNGVGSVRKLSAFPLIPVEETVTAFTPNQLIEYTVTSKLAPIKEHLGVMQFESYNGGTRLRYTITFKGVVPLLGPVLKVGLGQGIKRGLSKLAKKSL
ncbi:SRPBCC family protein [Agitococcus lubricus]|uniref:Polyketide cyclase/dehydrase/lipid transport protein n=1 Tax=Agitococcus lubricus TaxID=1077255 RepID=A0A2T5ISF1_9GAMM|nr:SRPBCC family protein [Agitococcus lubricus]PTQ86743.1 polyketide cyclase/dehydrase/lipid transport protein [Agitococcus lubricus]